MTTSSKRATIEERAETARERLEVGILNRIAWKSFLRMPSGKPAVEPPTVHLVESRWDDHQSFEVRHRHLRGDAIARIDLRDDLLEKASRQTYWIGAIANCILRRTARDRILRACGYMEAIVDREGVPIGRDGSKRRLQPWLTLVHPIGRYLLEMGAQGRLPPGHRTWSGETHDLTWLNAEMDERNEALGFALSGTQAIAIPGGLPATVVTSLKGKPLSQVVGLAPCGNAAVDRAIARLRIESVYNASDSDRPRLVLSPTPWMRAGEPPQGLSPWHLHYQTRWAHVA